MADIRETTWNFIQGEKYGTFMSAEKKWINKMHKLKKMHPDEVDIVYENKDGSIVVHLPPKVAKFSFPKVVSDEKKIIQSERMKNIQAKKNKKSICCISEQTDNNSEEDDTEDEDYENEDGEDETQ